MSIEDIKIIIDSEYFPTNQFVLEEIEKNTHKIITHSDINSGGIDNYLTCRMDPDDGRIFPYFVKDTGKGLNKICDYFLFVEQFDIFYIFIVEIKAGSGSSLMQIEASFCFMNFIIATAKRLGIDVGNTKIIKIRFHQSSKRKTNTCIPYFEEGILVYPWQDFRIKAIIDLYLQNHARKH